ncbi:MAG: hypothetical protein IKP07_03710 [Bacilli bacterium]|nr:hypothetical protein [Bacilli bacterium]
MTNKEKDISKIINNNTILLDNIIKYILINIKCNIEDISNNTQEYIIKLFQHIRAIKYKEVEIRNERKKIIEDLDDLKRAYVGTDPLSSISETGKNTGGKINNVELRQIKMLELKEALQDKLNESLLLEKSLTESTKIVKDFIELVPNPQHQIILTRMYLKCESMTTISEDYYYSNGTVQVYRKRGTRFLTELLNQYINKKK